MGDVCPCERDVWGRGGPRKSRFWLNIGRAWDDGATFGVGVVASATQRRGGEIPSVTREQKPDREKNRVVRARQRVIGRELRRIYDDVAREPVPDEFLD